MTGSWVPSSLLKMISQKKIKLKKSSRAPSVAASHYPFSARKKIDKYRWEASEIRPFEVMVNFFDFLQV